MNKWKTGSVTINATRALGSLARAWGFADKKRLLTITLITRLAPQAIRLTLLCVTLSLTATASQGQVVVQQSGQRAPIATQSSTRKSPPPLSLGLASAFEEGRNIHNLASVSAHEITNADRSAAAKFADVHPGPLRVGLARSVGAVPLSINGGSALRIKGSAVANLWTMAIRSPGAFGIRVHFSNFDVGKGAALVYALDANEAIVSASYTGKGPNYAGEFWTLSLPGDAAYIEVSGAEQPALEVTEVLHFDKPVDGVAEDRGLEPQELACHLDVTCEAVNPIARDAIGQMNFVDGGLGFVCSGTMINDRDDETTVPYFLTAHHCISTQTVLDTLEVVWLWQRSSCNGPLPSYFTLPRSTGGVLLATQSSNDMTFVRLAGDAPSGIGFAGWNTATSSGAYGIHHPGGSWKRVTFLSDIGFCPTCLFCLNPANFDYYHQDRGLIEGGSSGSGVFNASGQLVGQLFGTCCTDIRCSGYGCSNAGQYKAVYGEFEETYPVIKRWLDIGGTIYVDHNFTGTELGTLSQPFRTVTGAYNFAWDGARIKIKTGFYPENLVFSKRVIVLANEGPVTIGQ